MKLSAKTEQKQLRTLLVGDVKMAVLEIKAGIGEKCALFDPFGLCIVIDCFQCENCAYRITFDNGKVVETQDFENYPLTSKKDEYLLEFLTPVGKDIYGYLTDDSSDYRITRVDDKVVLRQTKEEQLRAHVNVSKNSNNQVDQTNRKRLFLTITKELYRDWRKYK